VNAVQNAIKAAIVGTGAVAASAVFWEDEERGAAKKPVVLTELYWDLIHSRDEYVQVLDEFQWRMSSLYYVRVQVRTESIYNSPGNDARFTLEKIISGLRRPTLEMDAEVVLQPDDQTYVHRHAHSVDGRTLNVWSFETGFRCVVDFPLAGPEDTGPNMQQVLIDADADVGEAALVSLDQTVDRPA
jgi:hypothetical protein